jgi:hypothetical protein
MLLAMYRVALLALLIGCSKPPKEDKAASPQKDSGSGTGEQIVVPTGSDKGPAVPAADDPSKLTQATKDRAQNPMFQLKPEEGTLTIAKAEGKAGAATSADIKLAPGTGYHVATDFPIKLWLETPDGVKVEKTFLTAGGRNKDQGDATTLTEQSLSFAVKATPEKAGTYEIQGVFSFGICEKDSCHPRTQPITIQVAAN